MSARADIFARVGAVVPVIQAPMAGAGGVALASATIAGGGVGSLPCAMLSPDAVVEQARAVRSAGVGPLNLNFFCHRLPERFDDSAWRAALGPFYAAEGVTAGAGAPVRQPFDAAMAAAVEAVRPAIVSFHFGLPDTNLLDRVRATGALVISSATSVEEARWLAARGCDAVIAQGYEAGGHAGWFLGAHRPVGTMALVPRIVDAVDVPVVAAGGIADVRGVAAAVALGAAGVQIGTAYLATAQSSIRPGHRARIGRDEGDESVFTNLLTGRVARGLRNRLIDTLGPIDDRAPPFPLAADALAPLRAAAEADGRDDFSPLWAGQAAALARATDARILTQTLGAAALAARKALS